LFGGFLIVIEGRLGDREKLKFALDTGVTHSVIDQKLADRIPVPRSRLGQVLSFDKTISAEWIEVPDIEFGPIRVTNFSMMTGDLRYFQSYATHVDAVIGLDLLHLSSFSIDYDAHKVTFGPVNTGSGVPMDFDGVCITVQLMMGDRRVRLLVDTGAQTLVLYEDRVVGRLPQLKMERETSGVSMGGWVQSKRGFISNARIGDATLEGTIFLVKAPPAGLLPGVDGYLGTAALKARRIDFNFDTKTLGWRK
jgi:predicted aspartyl protease